MSLNSTGPKLALTAVVMLGFAANSLLCRAALGTGRVDAFTFAWIRLMSGAASLLLICRALNVTREARTRARNRVWASPLALGFYAILFSAAYLRIDAGVGALILFGTVQATMIAIRAVQGALPDGIEWLGLSCSLGGLAYLTLPGKSAPDPASAILMAFAGISWGVYSILGQGSRSALADTRDNFVFSIPFASLAAIVSFAFLKPLLTVDGLVLAFVSGSVTSGLTYSLWYLLLPKLRVTQAAVVQLSVPAIAMTGSYLWLGEKLSRQLVIASSLILGGIAIVISARAIKQAES